MSNPIAFIDSSYLVTLSQLGDLGGAILARITASYEIHVTQPVLDELTGKNISPSVSNWLNNENNFVRDPTPKTDALISDGAITRNGGDLSIYEAAKWQWN